MRCGRVRGQGLELLLHSVGGAHVRGAQARVRDKTDRDGMSCRRWHKEVHICCCTLICSGLIPVHLGLTSTQQGPTPTPRFWTLTVRPYHCKCVTSCPWPPQSYASKHACCPCPLNVRVYHCKCLTSCPCPLTVRAHTTMPKLTCFLPLYPPPHKPMHQETCLLPVPPDSGGLPLQVRHLLPLASKLGSPTTHNHAQADALPAPAA